MDNYMGFAEQLLREFVEQGIIDEAPMSDEQLSAYYTDQLTKMMATATQPWEKAQLMARLENVKQGDRPRSANGGPIPMLPPAEWEQKTDPKIVLRIVGVNGAGLSPKFQQDHSSWFGQQATRMGLEESTELNHIKSLVTKLSGK